MRGLKRLLVVFPISLSMLFLSNGYCVENEAGSFTEHIRNIEFDIRRDLNNYETDVDFTFYVKSKNGNTFLHSTGSSNQYVSYKSASTSKLVTAAIILSLVEAGVLSLNDSPQDYISAWPKTGNLAAIKLKHLLNFTSGLNYEPKCINGARFDFEACVIRIATSNRDAGVPGREFYYSGSHLQVAGLMATKAAGSTSWAAVFRQFQAKTGLFLNSKYDLPSATNTRLAAGMHWTADDYMSFLEALYDNLILTPYLIKKLSSDQISKAEIGNSPALTRLGEDWHYGYGAWIECQANPYNCTHTERISSPGAYGAYPFIDYEHGYYGIVARKGEYGTYNEGVDIFRSVSEKVEIWAAMSCCDVYRVRK